ncbi:MAG: ABC transporter substrate-binding protein [Spirochaetes bacterium]|nr:ABC transporter substrate-binding protein [Spirochaetota bacterium]
MKKYFILLMFLIGCFGLVFMFSCSKPSNTIKIGFVDTYSGPAAVFGNETLEGFQMVIDEVNAKGGVLGKQIEFVKRDDSFKPDVALSMAKELVMKEKVDILIGTVSSAAALAVSDFASKEKIPFFVTNAKSERITGEFGHRYIFHICENTAIVGKAAAAALAKKPYLKYWIAGDDMEYGRALCAAVFDNLKILKPGVKKLGETWWKVGESDFVPYITDIMAAKPDFIIAGNSGAGVIGFQKAAKATGLINRIPIYQHTAIDIAVLAALGNDGPENVLGTATYMFYYPQTPANKAFIAEFQNKYKKNPTMPSFFGYMVANFIVNGYQKAGVFDREKFIDALEGMTLDSAIGKAEMRACDHQLLLPTYVGMTKKVPQYKDFLIGTGIVTVAPKDSAPSCNEIAKIRTKAKK